MRYLPTIARILLGLAFTVFGLNGFLQFIPQPKEAMPDAVVAFMTGMMATKYMMPLIAGTQVVSGVLLLLNRFVPLALAFLAPVLVNINLFHLFLAPASGAPGIVLTLLELYLAWCYRASFAPMLAPKARPTV